MKPKTDLDNPIGFCWLSQAKIKKYVGEFIFRHDEKRKDGKGCHFNRLRGMQIIFLIGKMVLV